VTRSRLADSMMFLGGTKALPCLAIHSIKYSHRVCPNCTHQGHIQQHKHTQQQSGKAAWYTAAAASPSADLHQPSLPPAVPSRRARPAHKLDPLYCQCTCFLWLQSSPNQAYTAAVNCMAHLPIPPLHLHDCLPDRLAGCVECGPAELWIRLHACRTEHGSTACSTYASVCLYT
jgi:hypothetical protein